ncbi:uncharacterized protein LOC120005598 isoform X4 [Tripterygium wilfordii]|uniref:uncharacterized protein LOC120005598 isoform X4 n=1 Tax=Tripterygium wilfordii TaxID=458696 RepID=UPI0018F7F09D|nr:uncharacterized protein LOC120005598 isoform X4 [Tripterygium wilfordii]
MILYSTIGPELWFLLIGLRRKSLQLDSASPQWNPCPCLLFVQEVVLSADIRCARCQSRVAEIMSRMKEMDSVSVNVLEKKVTVTSRYPVVKAPPKLVAALYKKPLGKAAIIKHIFRSSLR